jgi:hypothetical protein
VDNLYNINVLMEAELINASLMRVFDITNLCKISMFPLNGIHAFQST